MGSGIASEEDKGFLRIHIGIDPFGPCIKSLVESFHNIEFTIDSISFLIVVFPVLKVPISVKSRTKITLRLIQSVGNYSFQLPF